MPFIYAPKCANAKRADDKIIGNNIFLFPNFVFLRKPKTIPLKKISSAIGATIIIRANLNWSEIAPGKRGNPRLKPGMNLVINQKPAPAVKPSNKDFVKLLTAIKPNTPLESNILSIFNPISLSLKGAIK